VVLEHYRHQESSAKGTSSTLFISKKTYHHLGVDELKQAKIDVTMLTFLQFLLYLSMWCHFNGMWIMESCVHWIIWILKNLKWIKENSNIKVWFEKGCLTTSFNDITFIKGPFNFHNTIYFILNFFYGNGVLLNTSNNHSNFHIFWIFVYQKLNLKVLTCFGMIWNYDKFSKQNTKSGKIYALSKILISRNLIVKEHITYWGN
jgi:hypothetical protein